MKTISSQLLFSNDVDRTLLLNHREINIDDVLLILWCQQVDIPVSLTTYRDYGSSATEYAAAILAGKDPAKTTLNYTLSQLTKYSIDTEKLMLCTRNEPLLKGSSRKLVNEYEVLWAKQA